jgi:DNA primase
MSRFSKTFLYRLRNHVPIRDVIRGLLEMPCKEVEGLHRFLCPLCREFNTSIHPRENLGRCFRCRKNFNPIDLVMAERGCGFREAVDILKPCLVESNRRQA